MKTNDQILSVVKACRILDCIVEGNHRVSEISRKTGYNKTTVFKIINTFVAEGFVSKDDSTHQYYVGPFLQRLSYDQFSVHQVLVQCAMDEMEQLCSIIKETVALQIPQGVRKLILHAVYDVRGTGIFARLGPGAPIYVGAASKVLLAQYDEKELNGLLDQIQFIPHTETTPKNKEMLLSQVEEARNQGYSISFSEFEKPGLAAMAVPVNFYNCPVALGVAGFEAEIVRKKDLLLENLLNSAEVISDKLRTMSDS